MNRRTLLKNVALVIGGSVLLPSCLHSDGTTYVQLKHVQINEDQQRLMADIAEAIIPKTTTPGAKDLNLPAFTLKMVDDCFGKKEQEMFISGLVAFQNKIKKEHGKDFGDLDARLRETILTDIEKSANKAPRNNQKPDPIKMFYSSVKGQTVFGYTTSQYFMTKEIPYELVPGRYIVHYPVSKLKLKTA